MSEYKCPNCGKIAPNAYTAVCECGINTQPTPRATGGDRATLVCEHGSLRRKCDTCDLIEAERDLENLSTQLAEAQKEVLHWKANHTRELEVNRALRDRPDLGDRAKSVQALITQRDDALARLGGCLRLVKLARAQDQGAGGNLTPSEALVNTQAVLDQIILHTKDSQCYPPSAAVSSGSGVGSSGTSASHAHGISTTEAEKPAESATPTGAAVAAAGRESGILPASKTTPGGAGNTNPGV